MPKKLDQIFSPHFNCLRNEIASLKMTKQVLICNCAVLVKWSLFRIPS
jgi:hypothetical protein